MAKRLRNLGRFRASGLLDFERARIGRGPRSSPIGKAVANQTPGDAFSESLESGDSHG